MQVNLGIVPANKTMLAKVDAFDSFKKKIVPRSTLNKNKGTDKGDQNKGDDSNDKKHKDDREITNDDHIA